MSEGPWIRFFPSDWLAGTRGLSAAETGIYITLIAMMYERGAPLTDDRKRLARLCGTTPAALKATLSMLIEAGKIVVSDGGLWNEKVGVETENRREKSTQAKESADKRWRKTQEKQETEEASALQTQSDGNANHNHISSSLRSEDSARERKPDPKIVLQAIVDGMTAKRWVSHCGRKMTAEMAEAHVGQLRKIQGKGGNPVDAVDLAIANGWTTLELEWLERRGLKLAAQSSSDSGIKWREWAEVWKAERLWSPAIGPKPGENGCRMPPELLAELLRGAA